MNFPSDASVLPEQGVGRRLREAREAAGLGLSEVAQKLHIPTRVLESLEAEDWGRVGAPVFLRGQLRSYAKFLGIAQDVRTTQTMSAIATPELTPRSYTPPMRRFAEQSARRAVYVLITAAIMVPVWMASRQYIRPVAGEAAPLDAPAIVPAERATTPTAPRERTPMVASLAPMPRAQAPSLLLSFDGESWVEIVGSDGRTREAGLLRAGERRQYAAGEIARVKLGNAGAVRVEHEGKVQDLGPYLRANVARFTVSSDGSLAPPAQ